MVLVGMICPFPPPFFLKLSIHIRGGEFHKNPFLESSIPSSTWNIFGEREFPYKNSFRIKSPKKKQGIFGRKKFPQIHFASLPQQIPKARNFGEATFLVSLV